MVETILGHQAPKSFIYAPNYWQWFAHHKNHGILPHEIRHCNTQLDLIRHLGFGCNEPKYIQQPTKILVWRYL